MRNAAIVLGNAKTLTAEHELTMAMSDEEPLLRGAAAWALGKLQTHSAKLVLTSRLAVEDDETVRQEIVAALASGDTAGSSLHH